MIFLVLILEYLLLGYIVVTKCLEGTPLNRNRALKVCLAFGIAVGFMSLPYLLFKQIGDFWQIQYLTLQVIELATLSAIISLSRCTRGLLHVGQSLSAINLCLLPWLHKETTENTKESTPKTVHMCWTIMLFCLLCVCAVSTYKQVHTNSDGHRDAWAHWNTKAKFLASEDGRWKNIFSSEAHQEMVQDYPIMIPSVVARISQVLSNKPVRSAATSVSILFAVLSVLLLWTGLISIAQPHVAMLACLVLLSNDFYIHHFTTQIMDLPLSFYMLATVIIYLLYKQTSKDRILYLSGMMLGSAMWCKNEGLLMFGAFVCLHFLFEVINKKNVSSIKFVLLGGLPFLLATFYFKGCIADAPNYLMTENNFSIILSKAMDIERILYSMKNMLRFGLTFMLLPAIMLLLAVYTLNYDRKAFRDSIVPIFMIITINLTYFCILTVSTKPLDFHYMSCIYRLFLHTFPATIMIIFYIWKFTPRQRQA